jgi:hypothetical protein
MDEKTKARGEYGRQELQKRLKRHSLDYVRASARASEVETRLHAVVAEVVGNATYVLNGDLHERTLEMGYRSGRLGELVPLWREYLVVCHELHDVSVAAITDVLKFSPATHIREMMDLSQYLESLGTPAAKILADLARVAFREHHLRQVQDCCDRASRSLAADSN